MGKDGLLNSSLVREYAFILTEADVNATASDLTNATAKPSHDPPELSEFQSDLVAPSSGTKPLQAKYTIRVKPKLKDGVPQIQEIRIMPPKGNATKGFAKPLMVLKQNVTRPMIENIEIDVPEKGKKFSSKPSVEVIEGDHKELLEVNKGEATVENPAQKSETTLQGIVARHTYQRMHTCGKERSARAYFRYIGLVVSEVLFEHGITKPCNAVVEGKVS